MNAYTFVFSPPRIALHSPWFYPSRETTPTAIFVTAEYVALSAAWFTVQNAFKEWTTTTTKVKLSRLWAHPRFCFIVVDSAGQYRGATAGGCQRVNMETPFPIQATCLAQTDQIILTMPTYLPRRMFSLNVNQGGTKLELGDSTSVLLLNGFARERKQNIL